VNPQWRIVEERDEEGCYIRLWEEADLTYSRTYSTFVTSHCSSWWSETIRIRFRYMASV